MDKMEYVAEVSKLLSMSELDINELFNCGVFNDIVYGAIVMSIQNMEYDMEMAKKIVNECKHVFDEHTAGECRKAYKSL